MWGSLLIHGAISEAARKALDMLSDRQQRLLHHLEASFEARMKAEGKAEGKAEAILRVLAKRGVAVPDEVRERISACVDLAMLEQWLDRAVTAASVDELFEPG
jgi:hypothetical protein